MPGRHLGDGARFPEAAPAVPGAVDFTFSGRDGNILSVTADTAI